MKLNVDGGACDNLKESSGGGIIRDSNDSVIAGFAHPYGYATNTIAEFKALLDGLWLFERLRLRDVLVESDSLAVMNWLASRICRLWFLWDFWEEIKELAHEINTRFRHIFYEANMVANLFGERRFSWNLFKV
ncbi:uncharacterized protein LOC122296885 [Carya illinoinensis]|uniref:uncharacterized protein LOC122296885 n=1 Tax=Carya illinoinensis TaxID=32201 RepID=UPI001C71BB63|nr:uncharacterized protein LOC122296885 [Carya illinoinensis]